MKDELFYLDIAKKHDTPFYLYNGEVIETQLHKLETAFKSTSNFRINYAIKALNSIAVLKFLKRKGVFVDTVSLGEVKLALLAGFEPHEISYTPNGVPFSEIMAVHEIGAHITLDNSIQIKQFAKLKTGSAIGIRINPQIKAGAYKKIIVAGKSSKFGLPMSKVSKLHHYMDKYQLKIDGFHIHLGSGIDDIDSFLSSADILFKTAKSFKNLKFINFGGGFKVRYNINDSFLDINEIGVKLTTIFNTFTEAYPTTDALQLIIEPGKFLVSKSGVFIAEVTTVKKNNVFINSGFNHLMRPMYYNAYHQIKNISNTIETKKEYNIVGYICEQDYFGKKRLLNKPHVGDIILIENAGAYCATMASNYNSRLKPMELFTYKGETKVIRKREVFDDLIRNQIY